ncbi:fatty acid desaturase [Sphaerisporangium sp. B11E5]|uniref:fatty acid desaturase family protein n=1 Tax=Sphaerisporangium sp. B11E5 TaxID=3153563 RepID=UPI00325C43A1
MRRRIWRNSPWDALLLAFSLGQAAVTLWWALTWDSAPALGRIGEFAGLAIMMSYNIIVVSHLFTHAAWFTSPRLNAAVSVLNSVNIGQSVQAYHLTHVRNHHRFNNDAQDESGVTRDTTSTYRKGRDGEHQALLAYALGGALDTLLSRAREVLMAGRLWRVGEHETTLLALVSRREPRRSRELGQVRADRAAHVLSLAVLTAVSWQWTLLCYLPAFFTALTMVNVQNYYRHYGANPHDRAADSVSHYGRLYNLLTFNDGFHQEHHLSPSAHWSRLPAVRETNRDRLDTRPRVVSPVPAMLGFLHPTRPLLHRTTGQRSGS